MLRLHVYQVYSPREWQESRVLIMKNNIIAHRGKHSQLLPTKGVMGAMRRDVRQNIANNNSFHHFTIIPALHHHQPHERRRALHSPSRRDDAFAFCFQVPKKTAESLLCCGSRCVCSLRRPQKTCTNSYIYIFNMR